MIAESPLRILFLQGPPSRFWRELADCFEAAGACCQRINLALGDQVYWGRRGALNYRGSFDAWRGFLSRFLVQNEITDVFYYGDRFPYHATARDVAEALGIRCHAVENGYLRPDWLTHEPGGMGAYSRFPRQPDQIRALAARGRPPDPTVRFRHDFAVEAFHEVVYNLLNHFGWPLFPRYRADRHYNPLLDYLSWGLKALRAPRLAAAAERVEQSGDPFWLVILQLQSDYMIRANSPYRDLRAMLQEVFSSFAAHADPRDRLAVKIHPLDSGLENWERATAPLAADAGLGERVDVIGGGDLARLLQKAKGTIVVNSTVGLHSLRAGRPTLALGSAVYAMPGLTHQSGLDRFWDAPEAPDPSLVADLITALAEEIQVRGDFYDPAGRRHACAEIVARTKRMARLADPRCAAPTCRA